MGIGVGSAEKVEGGGGLLDEAIPEVKWEVRVCTGKTRNKVVFPCADGFLSGIGSMVVRGDKLVRYIFACHKLFEARRAFVVEELKRGCETTRHEIVIDDCEPSCEFFVLAAFETFSEDTICVMYIAWHDIFGAVAGCFGEPAHLIC